MRRALVVEPAGDRGSLTVSRALAAAGWTVGVATTGRRGLADASRSSARRHVVGAPEDDLSGFVAAVAAAVREEGYELVLPGAGDSVQLALSSQREEIPASLPLPEHRRVLEASDKLSLAKASLRVGLDTPRTELPEEQELHRFGFPAVVKERLHQDRAHGSGPTRIEAMIVDSADQARTQVEAIRAAGGAPVLQELVQGRLAALALVADRDGHVVVRSQQVTERTWPPSAGPSARARTVEVDPLLGERVAALIGELGWIGLAELQFMLTDSGEYKLIDFNGRTYGSIALAVAAGVNLPAVWAEVARDAPAAATAIAIPGTRYQWIEGDLRAALANGGGRLRRLWACLRYARGAAHDIWSPSDPRPAARYLRLRIARGMRHALGSLRIKRADPG